MKNQESWKNFIKLCTQYNDVDELSQLFDLFLTIEEKENLAARYLIIRAVLGEEITQREMSEQYHVSIAQVTRGSNALKIIDPDFKQKLIAKLNETS